jgi:hypothetical protein
MVESYNSTIKIQCRKRLGQNLYGKFPFADIELVPAFGFQQITKHLISILILDFSPENIFQVAIAVHKCQLQTIQQIVPL